MTLVLAWLRSRRFPGAAAISGVVAVVGASASDVTLELPLLSRELPLPLVLVLVPAVVMTTPLYGRFGDVEPSMVRAPLDRLLAALASTGLALAACLPGGLAAGSRFPWAPLLALMAAAVLAVVVLGELAWLPATVLGLGVVYVDFVYGEPVRRVLDAVGLPVLSAVLTVSVLVYARLGPRR